MVATALHEVSADDARCVFYGLGTRVEKLVGSPWDGSSQPSPLSSLATMGLSIRSAAVLKSTPGSHGPVVAAIT